MQGHVLLFASLVGTICYKEGIKATIIMGMVANCGHSS